ncbi:hypothetical protein, partial [Escherichia coli]|uniref:hypothetical protein n=1 Tax=Escherichia coli TaxID=562 RepID=UPI001BC844F3
TSAQMHCAMIYAAHNHAFYLQKNSLVRNKEELRFCLHITKKTARTGWRISPLVYFNRANK